MSNFQQYTTGFAMVASPEQKRNATEYALFVQGLSNYTLDTASDLADAAEERTMCAKALREAKDTLRKAQRNGQASEAMVDYVELRTFQLARATKRFTEVRKTLRRAIRSESYAAAARGAK